MKYLSYMLTVINSFFFNVKCFDIKTAMKFPIIISNRVETKGIKKGCIEIEGPIRSMMIRLGMSNGAYNRGKNKKSYLAFAANSKIIFKGYAHCANDFAINMCEGGTLILGDNFASNYGLIISCSSQIEFEDDVLLGWDCTFIDGDGHDIYDSTMTKVNNNCPIYIGKHVWMSAKVTCLKGVSIPGDVVVGYGSLLTRNYEEGNCIITGIPAKMAKKDISWRH